ncbi:MAG: hypothetical protein AB4426_11115 [Xenococcaceae cyanobacterium]
MDKLKRLSIVGTGIGMVALGTLAVNSAQAATIVNANFNRDSNGNRLQTGTGQIINGSGLFLGDGLMIDTENPNNNPLVLFNSSCGPDFPGTPCTGGDLDLASGPTYGTRPQKNVLIIQDLNGSGNPSPITVPDDDEDGGTFVFKFTDPGGVTFKNVGILDLDENNFEDLIEFEFFFAGNPNTGVVIDPSRIKLLNQPVPLNNGAQTQGVPIGNGMQLFENDNSFRRYKFSNLNNVTKVKVTLDDISGAITNVKYKRPEIQTEIPEPASVFGLFMFGAFCIGSSLLHQRK